MTSAAGASAPADALPRTDAGLTLLVEVVEKTQLSRDIVSLTLRAASGGALPDWEPGAHIDLVLPNGMARQYSLCGGHDPMTWRVGVLRDPSSRGGSAYVHDSLRSGDRIQARGPRNHFPLVPSPRYVFAAGGIGVTPLIPMAEQAKRSGADFVLIYFARSREAMAFLPELQERFGDRLVVNADDEAGLFDLAGYFREPRADTLIFACGPGPFLDATSSATAAWPSGTVHFERFAPWQFDSSEDSPFEVELAASGKVLHVPANRSVLDVLKEAGIPVLSSCTEGTCGTCEVPVLDGDIEHRDAVLSEEEKDSGEIMMVCVSRCKNSRLLLDL